MPIDSLEGEPWLIDKLYGGMTPASAKKSWQAAQERRSQAVRLAAVEDAPAAVKHLCADEHEVPSGGAPDEVRPPNFTDDALALQFAERHSKNLRYVAAWSKWLIWDGAVWKPDETIAVYDLVRVVCREASMESGKGKGNARVAAALASAQTISAVERLAKADRRLAATVDQWDCDSWLLNTPAGVIDLRTGILRPYRSEDYLTKITAVAPEGDCPRFIKFLEQVTDGDGDLQRFLQRTIGYCLTGTTREHALFFLFGSGANGKSVLINAVAGILGDYHRTAGIETFTVSSADRHPTDLAGLRGARLVTAVETEEGRRWAESKIKALTGGDKISARFMRQDFFEFTPQFKLVIAGNHKPGLRSVDEAIRRRFHLVPFTVTIPADERDGTLSEQLKREWPGILRWAVQGCTDWSACGLAPPEAVVAATAAYLESEDAIAAWIDESCDRDPLHWELSGDLYGSWTAWATRSGEHPGSTKTFARHLESRGFNPVRKHGGRGYFGLRLTHADAPDASCSS